MACPWEFFPGGGIWGWGLTIEAKAAQIPSVDGLGVAASGSGVSAVCEFAGHESGEYGIGLYLNQVKEGNSVSEAAYKNLLPTADGTGTGATQEAEVEPGLYKATVIVERNEADNRTMVSFMDSPWYLVEKREEGYVVTPYPAGMEAGTDREGPAVGEPMPEDICQEPEGQWGCDHSLCYHIVQEADTKQDAVLAGQCIFCGEVVSYSYVANTAYAAFLEEAIDTIVNTGEGEAVIDTWRWVSFSREVFEAISRHPETSLRVNYRYEGKRYTVTIPAGADVDGLCAESGFCGFRYLDLVFGGREISG